MQNVVVCDRDKKLIKVGEPSFKLTIELSSSDGKSYSKTIDLCSTCVAMVARGIADRVLLNEPEEKAILSAIGVKEVPKKVMKKSAKTSVSE